MRWLNFVTLSPALWLSCLSSGHASALPSHSIVSRQTPPDQNRYVYRGDGRAPSEIRDTGGFRPQGDDWQDHDECFDLDRHYLAGPGGCGLEEWRAQGYTFRTAYVSVALQRPTAENYGYWLYEMRRMPSILDNDDSEGEVMALGGMPWRAVRRYVRMSGTPGSDNRVDESMWINNPDYDEALYETGPNARYGYVNDVFPGALNNQSDDEDSDSDSSSVDSNETQVEPSTSNASRRRFNAADIYMSETPGAFELFGTFPPEWTQYAPNEAVPGPDAALLQIRLDDHVGGLLNHYVDMGAQALNQLFPDGDQVIRELFEGHPPAACSAFLGFGSRKRSNARRATDNSGCCKALSSFRKKTKERNGVTVVDICDNSPLNPPCTTVQAPRDQCVAVPEEYKGKVSGVKTDAADHICKFYAEPDCKGKHFEATNHAADLRQAQEGWYNDKVASMRCDKLRLPKAPERWEWKSTSYHQLCTRLDKLSIDFELANHIGSGTYDMIKLNFLGASRKPHVIVESPSPGYKVSQDIDMVDIFGSETVALDQIRGLQLLDRLTDHWLGGDAWELFGIKLRGRCAGTGISVALNDYASTDKELQAKPTEPGRFQYYRDWPVWSGPIHPKDWIGQPQCSHFSMINVNLHIADANYAGTNNDLYARVGKSEFLITRHPSRREVFTIDVDVKKAFKTKAVPVDKFDKVTILSKGGHDGFLPSEATVYGWCSNSRTSLSHTQTNDDNTWVYDGGEMDIQLPISKWVKSN
ncbi:hypothetical protein BB8028_0003g14650 [Beauveria bassiana]|uniref:Heat-labile enterotoxin IIB, A chain n=1 Tax=Beauveria bassiana TaxID=176275 RepID=A0A2S7Y9J9_BEABA|nr:hypothetical protein BB8028_0003g14650 [Beauveria bassiana]